MTHGPILGAGQGDILPHQKNSQFSSEYEAQEVGNVEVLPVVLL